MSDNSGNGGFVLYCVSGCYAEVHISWEIVSHFHSFFLLIFLCPGAVLWRVEQIVEGLVELAALGVGV
jgi:hypothetical protein